MKMFEKAKQALIRRTVTVYFDRRGELELEEYPSYFGGMGDLIAHIDKFESLSEIISDLEKGQFESIGFFPSDEDMMEEFFSDLKLNF